MKKIIALIITLIFTLCLTACSGEETPKYDPEYEAQTITVEGLAGGDASISVSELRELEQVELDASYQRTTGMQEEFEFIGPRLSTVISYLGGDISDYAGVGIMASDGYYCLIDAEIIANTPDILLGLVIDGASTLEEIDAPARLAVPNQFGPYWVRAVSNIVLYDEIPEKDISSVWLFDEITRGIEPYEYEYYGSADKAIELQQIFTRFDNVNSKAFFTMKSSDGFKKNETLSMVNKRYYIKYEGVDAPTNISPYIKLGMNVKNISWFSTNADAVIFPEQMLNYMDTVEMNGESGIPLSEVLYEVEIDSILDKNFDIIGTDNTIKGLNGETLKNAILVPNDDGGASVVFDETSSLAKIEDVVRIKISTEEVVETPTPEPTPSPTPVVTPEPTVEPTPTPTIAPKENVVLTVSGAGIEAEYSLQDLKNMTDGYYIGTYSVVNNWPTKKFYSAEGISISYILESIGVSDTVQSIGVTANDGYTANFTATQIMYNRSYFPNLMSGTADGAVAVPTIISWAYKEGTANTVDIEQNDLRLILGQNGLSDPNSVASVENVTKITISTDSAGKWETPVTDIPSGEVEAGTQVTLMHDYMDAVKIYYTIDGTEPTTSSSVYNPSTSYFQPDLIQPITIDNDMTITVMATGYGRWDSEIASYEYTVK